MSALRELNKKNLADFDDVEICIKQVEINYPIHAEIVESAARIYADLRARIVELENPWQPIETCPENEHVLLLEGYAVIGKLTVWDDGEKAWSPYSINKPTHWMPLPKPPEVEE